MLLLLERRRALVGAYNHLVGRGYPWRFRRTTGYYWTIILLIPSSALSRGADAVIPNFGVKQT